MSTCSPLFSLKPALLSEAQHKGVKGMTIKGGEIYDVSGGREGRREEGEGELRAERGREQGGQEFVEGGGGGIAA